MMNLGQYIQNYCEANDISIRDFAEKSGINRSYLFVLRRQTRNPGVETIRKAALTMGMSYDDLLRQIDIGLSGSLKNKKFAAEIPVYTAMPLTDENIDGYIAVTHDYKDTHFAYRLDKNDMAPLIFKNSILIVRLLGTVENDSIVVAKVNGETYCRKYIKTDKGVSLVAVNPKESAISLDKNKMKTAMVVYGKVEEVRFSI